MRPGTSLGEGVKIGNFVETKAATLEAGAKVNHLSYIGDAHVGANANIGAGTITCNYDGFSKHKTEIGEGAFVGTNSSLVAPVKIGNGAYIGSGSVITKDVPDDAMAVERSPADQPRGRSQAVPRVEDEGQAERRLVPTFPAALISPKSGGADVPFWAHMDLCRTWRQIRKVPISALSRRGKTCQRMLR